MRYVNRSVCRGLILKAPGKAIVGEFLNVMMTVYEQGRSSAGLRRRLSASASAMLLLIMFAPSSVFGQGAADEFNPNADGPIHAIAIQADGKIIIGGDFTTAGGMNRRSLARLNPDGSADNA